MLPASGARPNGRAAIGDRKARLLALGDVRVRAAGEGGSGSRGRAGVGWGRAGAAMGRGSGTFERPLDKATSQLLLETDWESILQICDLIRQGDTQ